MRNFIIPTWQQKKVGFSSQMLNVKLNLKRVPIKVALAALGAAYLTTFSTLDLNILVKPYAAIIPVQLLAFIYGIYLIYGQKSNDR
jgi:hypothetical protein